MRNFAAIVAVMTCCSAVPAVAAPVYLDCLLGAAGEPATSWTLNLNEDQGTVTFQHSHGSGTMRALFTPDKVSWLDGSLTVDRVTLKFTRIVKSRGQTLGPADEGTCKVAAAPQRAF